MLRLLVFCVLKLIEALTVVTIGGALSGGGYYLVYYFFPKDFAKYQGGEFVFICFLTGLMGLTLLILFIGLGYVLTKSNWDCAGNIVDKRRK